MNIVLKPVTVIDNLEKLLEKRPLWIYVGLICLYVVQNFTAILVVTNLYSINLPVNFLYITKLLFSENGLNPAISNTIATPSNQSLIYPLGFFVLTQILGSLTNIIYFTFIIQGSIPLLIFAFFRSVTGRSMALLLAILSIAYAIANPISFRPDSVIQPLMLMAMVFLFPGRPKEPIGTKRLVIIGLLTGVVIILKHNIGIFFAVLCGTVIFFRAFGYYSTNRTRSDYFVYILIAGYLIFGLVVFRKLLYFDEAIYFLLPYFCFWILTLRFYRQNSSLIFHGGEFLKQAVIFSSVAFTLPVIIFVWFGGVLGYGKYWYSLFEMGFDFLQFWDYGIIGIIKSYNSLSSFLYFVLPFCINVMVFCTLFKLIADEKTSDSEKLNYFEIGSISTIGILMYFPLEDIAIAIPKSFISIFVLAWFLKKIPRSLWVRAAWQPGRLWSILGDKVWDGGVRRISLNTIYLSVALLMALWQITLLYPRLRYRFSMPVSYGSTEVQAAVGMPMHRDFAEQLSKQVEIINRVVQNKAYYVIEDTGGTLMGLATIVDNKYPQYYMRMDKAFLNQSVTHAIISSIAQVPYVVVQSKLYDDYLSKTQEDGSMNKILDFIHKNYVVLDKYEAPMERNRFVLDLYSFVVMKKS